VVCTAIAGAVALGIALTAAGCAVAFRLRMLVPNEIPDARPTLILPATGPLPGLEALFDALLGQTLAPGRMIVAVESPADPAFARVSKLAARYPALPVELVIAGISSERAQKCTNLLAALARLGRDVDEFTEPGQGTLHAVVPFGRSLSTPPPCPSPT